MKEQIIVAGAGGQGIMLLGKVLAEAAMRDNKYVTWLPSYGAEVRGGTAHCMVVISDEPVGSPYIDKADTLIIMNKPSLERFRDRLRNRGLLIVNSSLVNPDLDNGRSPLKSHGRNAHAVKYPFTDIAVKLGNIKVANMVALGCYLAHNKILDLKIAVRVIEEIAPPDKKDLVEINKQALFRGSELKNSLAI
jgi:2-oxoglutarate ferredoxin oxidoreductase subunit gamma